MRICPSAVRENLALTARPMNEAWMWANLVLLASGPEAIRDDWQNVCHCAGSEHSVGKVAVLQLCCKLQM